MEKNAQWERVMNAKTIAHRYDIDMDSAANLLDRVEKIYEIDWSEASWEHIDARFALTAFRMSLGAPIAHVLTQNAMTILNWYEEEYI